MVEGDASAAVAMAGEVVGIGGATRSGGAGGGSGDEAGTSGVVGEEEEGEQEGISAVVVLSEGSVPVLRSDEEKGDTEDSLFPRAHELPGRPPRAIECNYTHWAALGKCPAS